MALGKTLVQAFQKALDCDPVSAFGGIIAFNRPIGEDVAGEVIKLFSEVVIAPSASEQARTVFSTKKNLRLLLTETMPNRAQKTLDIKSQAKSKNYHLRKYRSCGVIVSMVITIGYFFVTFTRFLIKKYINS